MSDDELPSVVLPRSDVSPRESTSSKIRALARDGMTTADIARFLGIRYQHAYKVLRDTGPVARPRGASGRLPPSKPPLQAHFLAACGFELSSRWVLSDMNELVLIRPLPRLPGVYAFACEDAVLYVGAATMGLAKRLYFYGKPGITQRTSQRLNALMKQALLSTPHLDIYTAVPNDLAWNGLPINGVAGLELGLIKTYALPWNKRSAG